MQNILIDMEIGPGKQPGDEVKNTVVYADLTFLVNFIMDFVLLWITNRLVGISLRYWRLLAVSLLAALYGTGSLFPGWQILYCLPLKIAASISLVWLAMRPLTWPQFKKGVLFFYILSFTAGGAAQAFSYMVDFRPAWISPAWFWLGAGLFCLLFIAYQGEHYFLRRLVPGLLRYEVCIKIEGRNCTAQGFLDTGNGLCDPLTRRPVIVTEYAILRECLPEDLRLILDRQGRGEDCWQAVSSTSWAHRLRLIPFRTVGQPHGIMMGLRADEVVVRMNEQEVVCHDLVIGIYYDRLSRDESYQMLIPSTLLMEC